VGAKPGRITYGGGLFSAEWIEPCQHQHALVEEHGIPRPNIQKQVSIEKLCILVKLQFRIGELKTDFDVLNTGYVSFSCLLFHGPYSYKHLIFLRYPFQYG
jgi:hypothetical protein